MIKQVKYYIKKNNGEYFEVWPQKRVEITNAPYQNEYFYRNGFSGEITFRNYEKVNYKNVSNQKLFDTLLSITKPRDLDRFKDEFDIKLDFNNGEFIVYGYFGILDYNVDNNATGKIITIKPTIKDEYTTLFRNWDNKVDVFGSSSTNKLVNGNFEVWSNDNQPYNWTLINNADVEKFYYLGSNKAKLTGQNPLVIADIMAISNSINSIVIGSQIYVDFGYILQCAETTNQRFSRFMKIVLSNDTETYYLNQQLSWASSYNTYSYANNVLSYTDSELNDITKLSKVSLMLNKAPISGTLTITFFNDLSVYNNTIWTIIDNVIVRVNTNNLNKISATILSNYLQVTSYYSLPNKGLRCSPRRYHNGSGYAESGGIDMYFDDDGKPTSNVLTHSDFAPDSNETLLKLGDWIEIFKSSADSQYKRDFYKCELAEIEIYECKPYTQSGKVYVRIIATAKFARDYTTTDGSVYTQKDYEDGKCDQSEIGTTIPPARNVGWTKTAYLNDKGQTEWCRTPFNNDNNPWVRGTVETENLGKVEGFIVNKKLSSKRKYLTTIDNSTGAEYEFTTCIDLRSFIKNVFNATHSSFSGKNVVSQFFWNDFPNELLTFDSTNNYVTGRKNELNNIACLHTFDVKTIGSTEELTEDDLSDSRLQLSLKEILTSFENRFKILNNSSLMWFIDLNGDLRIEHQSYFYMTGISTASERPENSFPNRPTLKYYDQYKYIQELLPSKITLTQNNAGYSDFIDNVVKFDEIVSGSREEELKNEITIDKFTTDLKYCLENKSNLDNGVILINFEKSGENLVVSYGKIQLDNTSFINGNLSISSILKNYCRYEGTFTEGYINNDSAIFSETPYNKEGKELTLLGIVTQNFIRTKIGTGKVISRKFNFDISKLTTTVTLRYSSRIFIDGGNGKILNLGFYI